MIRFYLLAFTLLLGNSALVLACDVDADCGAGGSCIKREKRARGVCYGRSDSAVEPSRKQAPSGNTAVQPRPVTGEHRERAKQWLGDPDQLIKENLPGTTSGAVCMVNQDCPAGLECVIAGFEGRCVKL